VITFEELKVAFKRRDAATVLANADALLISGNCPPEQVGWVFYYKCDAALDQNQVVLSIAAGEQALSWSQSAKDAELEGRVRICLSFALMALGRVAEAAALLEAYVAGLPHHPEWERFADLARFNLAWAYRQSGRLVEAVAQYRAALALPESRPETHIQIRQNLAWALMLLGDVAGARAELDLVTAAVREQLDLARMTSLWVDRAALYLLEGDREAAKRACQQVLQALDERQRHVHLATTYITLGRIALAEANLEETQRCAMLARAHAEQAERWDLHNEGTQLWVAATQKGGNAHDQGGLATVARLLLISRSLP
jgi:tetratricopeptide (TPR) repeat protein